MKVLLALFGVAFSTIAAHAGDISECRAISDNGKRLACYDALPLGTSERNISVPVGWYAGIGSGIGSVTGGDAAANNFHAFVGREWNFGETYIGLEGDIRTDLANHDASSVHTVDVGTFPSRVDTYEEVEALMNNGAFFGQSVSIDRTTSESFSERFSPSLSAVVGQRFGRISLYGRGGAGLSLVDAKTITDDRNSRYCGNGASASLAFNYYNVECDEVPGSETSSSELLIRPFVIAGAGFQYDFNQWFARTELQVRHLFYKQGFTQYDGSFSVGMKFQ
jgi:hypothetical protein